jgi:hypothetical protein
MNIPEFYRLLNVFKVYFYRLINSEYYSITDLQGRTGDLDGDRVLISSFYSFSQYPNAQKIARWFYWESTRAKSEHDGANIISPTMPWDGTQTTLSDFFNKVGETDPSGTGCWVARADRLDVSATGTIGDGAATDTTAINKASSLANVNDIPLTIAKGNYSHNGTTYAIDGTFTWFNHGYTGAVNPVLSARNNAILLTAETSSEVVQDSKYSKIPLSITVRANGAQHADCIRGTTFNYSTDGNGNTCVYMRMVNDTGAFWGAAIHGETRHAGGTSMCLGAEAASYSDTGTFAGLIVNNTTNSAEATHPTTGAASVAHSGAMGIYVLGSNNTDPKGGWVYGMKFHANSMRASGETIRIEANAPAYHLRVISSAAATGADILLEDSSPVGIVLNGTYSSGNAIRTIAGNAIAFEGTGAIKVLYDSGTSSIQWRNGATERFRMTYGATPSFSLNGTQVLTTRRTGWTADTGTAKRTANATYSGTAEAAYTQATIQALMDAVRDATQTIKAMKDDNITHGFYGA